VNAKELVDTLCKHYPEGLLPDPQVIADLVKTVRKLSYGPKQIEQLYEELTRECNFFPRTYDVISAASKLSLPLAVKKPETVFKTWYDEKGRPWAKKLGSAYPESSDERFKRYEREAIPVSEGREYWDEAFAMATQDVVSDQHNDISFEFVEFQEARQIDGKVEWEEL